MASNFAETGSSRLSCAICYGVYSRPKILRCGHTFCDACLRPLIGQVNADQDRIICPECRTETVFNRQAGLTPNSDIQRMIDELKARNPEEGPTSDQELGIYCSHFVFWPFKTKTFCKHCNKKFCDSCLVCHQGRLKMDINLLANSYRDRLNVCIAGVEGKTGAVREKAEEAEKKIVEYADDLAGIFMSAIEKKKGDLFSQVREMEETENAKLASAIQNAKEALSRIDSEISQPVARFNEKPTLKCSLDEVIELHKLLVERDREISRLDRIEEVLTSTKVDFNGNEGLVKEMVNNLSEVANLTFLALDLAPGDPMPSDVRRIFQASEEGDLGTMKKILNWPTLTSKCKKELLECPDPTDEQTPLMKAARNGYLEIVRFLVNDQKVEKQEKMAVHLAADNGHLPVVQFFIEKDMELLESEDEAGDTVIDHAAKNNRLNVVQHLVENFDFDLTNSGPSNRPFPLWAIEDGWGESVIDYLLSENADILTTGDIGHHAILLACRRKRADIVRLLIRFKLTLARSKSPKGQTPLHITAEEGDLETAKFLVEEAHASVNARDADKKSPLSFAVRHGHLDCVKYLLEKGSNFGLREAKTAISDAIIYGQTAIVRYFLEIKPELLQAKNLPKTLHDLASENEHDEIIALLDEKTNPSKRSGDSAENSIASSSKRSKVEF